MFQKYTYAILDPKNGTKKSSFLLHKSLLEGHFHIKKIKLYTELFREF